MSTRLVDTFGQDPAVGRLHQPIGVPPARSDAPGLIGSSGIDEVIAHRHCLLALNADLSVEADVLGVAFGVAAVRAEDVGEDRWPSLQAAAASGLEGAVRCEQYHPVLISPVVH